MRDLLPDAVFDEIANQFRTTADAAVEDFEDNRADEDAITGALASTLKRGVRGRAWVGAAGFTWRTSLRKLRGRGRGAAEKVYGADAVLEIEVVDRAGEVVGRKLVPLQAKKNWTGTDRTLAEQCQRMDELPGNSLAVDYRGSGYTAVRSEAVVAAGGSRRAVPDHEVRSLGDALAGEFLECRVGSRDLYYDPDREVMVFQGPTGVRVVAFGASYRVKTTVTAQ
jgi:hypothetical protein